MMLDLDIMMKKWYVIIIYHYVKILLCCNGAEKKTFVKITHLGLFLSVLIFKQFDGQNKKMNIWIIEKILR